MMTMNLIRSFASVDFNTAISMLVNDGWIETGIQESGESFVLKRGLSPVFGALRKEGMQINFYRIAL